MKTNTVTLSPKVTLSPRYQLFRGPNHIAIYNEVHQVVIEGRPACEMADLFREGGLTEDELESRITSLEDRDAVMDLIKELTADELLLVHAANLPDEALRQWAALEVPFSAVATKVAAAGVAVVSTGPDALLMTKAMVRLGIPRVKTDANLRIMIAADWAAQDVELFNRQMLVSAQPWMLVAPVGHCMSWAVFQPGQTACPRCLVQRRRKYRPMEQWVAAHACSPDSWTSSANAGWPMAQVADQVALAVLRYLVCASEAEKGGMLHCWHGAGGGVSRHVIKRLASCPNCGVKPLIGKHKRLQSSSQINTESLHSLADPVTGILTGLTRLSGRAGVSAQTWIAGHPLSFKIDTLDALRFHLRCHSTGKGATEAEARASAVYEAAERMSGVWREGLVCRYASYRTLGARAVHPNALQLFSNDQLRHRLDWNASAQAPLHVPKVLDPDVSIGWVEAVNLNGGANRLVPAAYAYYEAPDAGNGYSFAHSNGCAAGQTRTDAILYGLYELIERDAISIWWYNALVRPALDLEAINHPYVQLVLKVHRQKGRQVWVLDITHDVGIPVLVALSRSDSAEKPAWLMGFGCHADAEVAVCRALAEMNQMMPMVASGSPMPALWTLPDAVTDEQIPFLFPDRSCESVPLADIKTIETEGDPLASILASLYDLGIEVLAIDQTDPDIGVQVIRVMAPGLYHFWRRLGGERLGEVPLKMGWREADENGQMPNPYSIVL